MLSISVAASARRSTQVLASVRIVLLVVTAALLAGCAPRYGNGPGGHPFESEDDAYASFERQVRGESAPPWDSEFLYRFYNGWTSAGDVRFRIKPRYKEGGFEATYLELNGPLEYVLPDAWEAGHRTTREIYAEITAVSYKVTSEICPNLGGHVEELSALITIAAADVSVGNPGGIWLDSPNVRRYSVGDGVRRSTVVAEVELEEDLYQATMRAIEYVKGCSAAN